MNISGFSLDEVKSVSLSEEASNNSDKLQPIWFELFGGEADDDPLTMLGTSDGGYLIAGELWSLDENNRGIWLLKTDEHGEREWERYLDESSYDQIYSIRQTSDDGFIIITSDILSYSEYIMLKTDSEGNKKRDRVFNIMGDTVPTDFQQTSDGGYIITGRTKFCDENNASLFLIKTDSKGKKLWSDTYGRCYGWTDSDVQQTSDGGYAVIYEVCMGYDCQYVLLKTDSMGIFEWNRTFTHSYFEFIEGASDDGLMIAGKDRYQDFDLIIIKMDLDGEEIWNKTLSNSYLSWTRSIKQTSDSGFIVLAERDHQLPPAIFVIKLNSNGDEVWKVEIIQESYCGLKDIFEVKDNRYVLTGYGQPYFLDESSMFVIGIDYKLANSYAKVPEPWYAFIYDPYFIAGIVIFVFGIIFIIIMNKRSRRGGENSKS